MSSRTELLHALLRDLHEESFDLDGRVAELSEALWRTPTPAKGWTIADTINHLAATDDDAHLAATRPEAFQARLAEALEQGGDYVERAVELRRPLPHEQVLAAWRAGRAALDVALRHLPEGTRVPWFGPAMSAASFVTARLMETWAHGQDVADALGQVRTPTARLRSVAEIGVRARPFSYAAHGLPAPAEPVHVALTGPDGESWTWGPAEAADVVRGPALDFCLLVTQRRHRADLALEASGPLAQEWLGIAQAFAGPPGGGREPQR